MHKFSNLQHPNSRKLFQQDDEGLDFWWQYPYYMIIDMHLELNFNLKNYHWSITYMRSYYSYLFTNYCIFLGWILRQDTSWRKANCFLSQNFLEKQVGDRRLFKETTMTITIIVAGFFQDIKQFAVNNALYANSDGLGTWNLGFRVLKLPLFFANFFWFFTAKNQSSTLTKN